ncbi:MAG: HEAT repeat domain-containing protein [Elusimicrobiota bacterium]|nr:HEAT repeat domain-containing protein [Endomicrobiia bacterium]MDW8166201.1 HEAT repeat domain-containing protein [Elusimicrobiota bacterium]
MNIKINLIFKKLIVLLILFFSIKLSTEEDVKLLYNAAVEKYIKNDYDKAAEYMEKVYSIDRQEKYKNFLICILAEAANNAYMKQNYKKAYEYTSKALKYTQDNSKINELHRILTDILGNQKSSFNVQQKPTLTQTQLSQETQPKKQQTQKKQPVSETEAKPTQITQQVVYIEDKRYKILFYSTTSILFFVVIGWFITKIKLQNKIKKELQKQIFDLQKENSKLNLELIQIKTELEKTKEREQLYKKYLDDYKKDSEEKIKLITELQNKFEQIYKNKTLQPVISKPATEHIFNQHKTEFINFVSKPPKSVIESEYQLELYREKIATMLKTLYEINPDKALSTVIQMVEDKNPFVRANVAYALAEIANDKTVNLLIKLFKNDEDPRVKQEALRKLVNLKNKIENNEVVLSEEIKSYVISIVKEEKLKGEWLF